MAQRPRRIGSAHLLAFLACCLALGGGAYAAETLPDASIGSHQLRSRAVTGAKVRLGTLRPWHFSPAARRWLRGRHGARGARGQPGARVIAAAAAVPQVALQESTQFSTDVWRATASEAAATANSWAVEVRALCVTVAP
jgi:hypothetical protein